MPSTSLLQELLRDLRGEVRSGAALASGGLDVHLQPTGFPELDACLGGGFPRGRLSEVTGAVSTGVTSLVSRLLAGVTRAERLGAWIDIEDALDPRSCSRAGVDLSRLLWARVAGVSTALEASEVLLGSGEFALVILDLRNREESRSAGERAGKRLAAAGTWLRLRHAAAKNQSSLVVLPGRDPCVRGIPSAVRIELAGSTPRWSKTTPLVLEGVDCMVHVHRSPKGGGRILQICL